MRPSDAIGDTDEKPSLLNIIKKCGYRPDEPPEAAIQEARQLIHTQEEEQETRCGIGAFKPRWLQFLARKECYLIVYCLVSASQGMYSSYSVSIISTFEKRFKLNSKLTGIMLIGNDITQMALALLLGYFGNHGHRPRWVGSGVLCAALSCFMAALPHLLYGPGQDALELVASLSTQLPHLHNDTHSSSSSIELCPSPGNQCEGMEEEAEEIGAAVVGSVACMFVSQLLVGASNCVFFSISLTYLDDNVSKKTYPLYFVISLLVRMLGPVTGFMVGGKVLSLWIDPSKTPNIDQRDPRWLGAWWMGYLIMGVNLTVLGCVLMLFPRTLPRTLRRQAKRVVRQAEWARQQGAGPDQDLYHYAALARSKKEELDKPSFRSLGKALHRLLTNKIYVANVFNTMLAALAYIGYYTFSPKYLESQFRRSASEANYYTGVAGMTSMAIGTALGGGLMRWVQPRPRVITGYNSFLTLFYSCALMSLAFIGCPSVDLVGPGSQSGDLACSKDCGCSEKLLPMCSEDNTTLFYSPCFAACSSVDTTVTPVEYSDCRCITNNSTSSIATTTAAILEDGPGWGGFGVSGYCPEVCNGFMLYIIAQIIIKSVWSTGKVGASMINLRAVEDQDKGLAMGVMVTILSFLSFIPAPIMMGAIIDSACLVWDNSCGKKGNCWHYDTNKFRYLLHLVPAAINLLSILGDLVVFYYSPTMDFYGDKVEKVELKEAVGNGAEGEGVRAPTSQPPLKE